MQKTALAASALLATTVAVTSCGTETNTTVTSSGTTATTSTTSGANESITIDQTYALPDNAGNASLRGTMVVENGVVKSITIPDAQGPQAIFAKNISKQVVGKSIDGLHVDSITGASLTVAAFNEFLKNRKS